MTRRNWERSGFQEAEAAKGPKDRRLHGGLYGPRSEMSPRRIRSVTQVSVPRTPSILEKTHMKKADKSLQCQVLDFTMRKWHIAWL